jgi:sugar lactone lactonase YvrE
MIGKPELFRDTEAILGESLVWDGEADSILWCDITRGLLHASPLSGSADGAADASISLPAPLASFHPAADGFVVSLGARVVLADADGHITRELAQIDHLHDGLRLNEGKVDPYGRWVTGSMNLLSDDADGAYYSVDEAGTLKVLRGGLGVANGLEWSLDGSRVYFTDTSVSSIYSGEYTPEGDILEVEVWHHGTPNDGLAIDTDGCFWSGLYGDGRVVRYDPSGEEIASIDLPVPNVTSVAFGGADLSTLFVTTARENLTENQLEEHPLSGGVFTIQTSTSGVAPRTFGSTAR